MRLIIQFTVGDGCTYWATETVPVIYESAEAFAVDFETFCLDNKDKYFGFDPQFAGRGWDVSDFFSKGKYWAPDVLTVDEFFAGVE